MNILKKFRNPIYAIYASIFMLFFSCSQYEMRNSIVNSAFDSELYDAFKKGDIELFVNNNYQNKKIVNPLENSKDLLKRINEHYGTNVQIPDSFFQLHLEGNKDEIINTSIKKGWLTQEDVYLSNELVENINDYGFDSAINTFKNQTLALNLTKEEFSGKNTFVNMLEIMHDENPSLIETNKNYFQKGGPWDCFVAVVLFILSLASAFACVTIILCGFALYGLAIATDELVEECN